MRLLIRRIAIMELEGINDFNSEVGRMKEHDIHEAGRLQERDSEINHRATDI